MNINKLQPLGDRVLIKRIIQEKTHSGLFMPDEVENYPQTGSVIAIGKGFVNSQGVCIKPSVSIGDVVYHARHAGIGIDEDYLLLRSEEVLGIIE